LNSVTTRHVISKKMKTSGLKISSGSVLSETRWLAHRVKLPHKPVRRKKN
jgi:hypothetical protein